MINSIFSTQKLGTLCSKIGSGATPRGGSQVYLDSGEIALIRSQNIRNEYFSKNGLVYIEKIHADKLANVTIEPDDVLLNITGDSVARCCQVAHEVIPARVNQHVAIIRPISEKLDPLFLRYFFISPEMQNYMLSLAGTGATRNALTKIMIESFDIPVPDLPKQKAIAHILGSLDDKIELNRKMNETLEAMAQAMFKSWFVDFDPVIDNALAAGNTIPEELTERTEQRKALGDKRKQLPVEIQKLFPSEFIFTDELGWIPKGWEACQLGNITDIRKGKNITKKQVVDGNIPVVAGGLKPSCYHNTANVNGPAVTVSASGANAGYINLYLGDIWASDCSYISSQEDFLYFYYLFLKGKQKNIFEMQTGSAQPHIYPKHLQEMRLCFPQRNVLKTFEKSCITLFNKISNNKQQNIALSKLRDTLLPKLLSGELRIKETEKLVEELI